MSNAAFMGYMWLAAFFAAAVGASLAGALP
jgi:hypothetical protein